MIDETDTGRGVGTNHVDRAKAELQSEYERTVEAASAATATNRLRAESDAADSTRAANDAVTNARRLADQVANDEAGTFHAHARNC